MINKFHKLLSGYTIEQLQEVFAHSQAVWAVMSNKISSCIVPKPIAFDSNGIDYEFLKLPQSLSMLLHNKANVDNVMARAGEALAFLHGCNSIKNLMHGDFVPHNIFTDGDKIFLIDAHPPELLGFRKDILYGNGARDILCFVNAIPSCIGFRKAFKYKKYIYDCYHSFINGYLTQKSRVPFGSTSIYCSFAQDVFLMKYRSNWGIRIAVLHVIASIYWFWMFLRCIREC